MSQERDLDQIESAKRQLQTMIDLNPECMLMLDENSAVIRANRALVDLVGGGAFSRVLSKPVHDLFDLDDLTPLMPVLSDEDDYGSCRLETHIEAETRTLEFTRVGGDQKNHTVFIVVKDISDRLLEDQAAEQEHKQTAVQQMIGAMMHHLNQPLTVIMLRANMLTTAVNRGQHSDEQVLDALSEISEMAMKLAKLLSRIEAVKDFEVQHYTDGIDIMKIDGDGI